MSQAYITSDITICTVSYGHRSLIETNIEFVKKMNPEIYPRWIIVENTPPNIKERFASGEVENCLIKEGIQNDFTGIAPGSYHHATGLNSALKEVKTRYVLVIDPDFYIVKKNWINATLGYMNENNLAFFGAPYNPKRYMKYRYFPCIHCLFIDLSKVDKEKIDFTPQYKK